MPDTPREIVEILSSPASDHIFSVVKALGVPAVLAALDYLEKHEAAVSVYQSWAAHGFCSMQMMPPGIDGRPAQEILAEYPDLRAEKRRHLFRGKPIADVLRDSTRHVVESGVSVYLAGNSQGPLTKIGFSKNPQKRIWDIRRKGVPGAFMIAWGPGSPCAEQRVHAAYDEFRISGEWFDLTEEHLEEIISGLEMKRALPEDEIADPYRR